MKDQIMNIIEQLQENQNNNQTSEMSVFNVTNKDISDFREKVTQAKNALDDAAFTMAESMRITSPIHEKDVIRGLLDRFRQMRQDFSMLYKDIAYLEDMISENFSPE
jgi:hypothetical protein